jgi:hypothetical protein
MPCFQPRRLTIKGDIGYPTARRLTRTPLVLSCRSLPAACRSDVCKPGTGLYLANPLCQRARQGIEQTRNRLGKGSRRPDSNRGPLHYE